MTRTTYLSAFILLLLITVSRAVPAEDVEEKRSYLPAPAPQTSVTSTAFNPNIQNAGGTTNSAGTFDVVSLARSSNYEGGNSIAVTTSYVVSSPAFANSAAVSTPAYLTQTAVSTDNKQNGAQSSATKSSVSLIGTASVSAVSSNPAMILSPFSPQSYNALAAYMVTFAAVVFAAVVAL